MAGAPGGRIAGIAEIERVEKGACGHFFEFLQGPACTPLAYTGPLSICKNRRTGRRFLQIDKG